MIRVNLIGGQSSGRSPIIPAASRATLLGMLLLIATLGGVATWWWNVNRQVTALETRIAKSERDLVRLKAAAALVDRAVARKGELVARVALIDRLRTAQKGPVNLLSTISRSLPDGLWLMELTQKGPGVQIEGRATSLTAITDFVERLQASGVFDRPVEIVTTGMEVVEDASVVRFAIKAQAAGTAAAAAAAAAAQPPRKGT
jgi:type IV pilus assembly protein PilN